MKKKQKETIKDAIAHLDLYIIESDVCHPPLAVINTIKELKELLK